MKKTILFFFLVLVVFSCSKKPEDREVSVNPQIEIPVGPVTLEFLVYANQGMMKNYEIVIERFNDSHDNIQVEIYNVYGEDWTDFEQTFRSYLLSGKSPDIVDISVIYRDSMIDEGLFMDLMPYAKKSAMDFDLYFKNQFDGLLKNETLYGIPSGAMLMGVFINKDLFRKAGVAIPPLDWKNTWSMDDFTEASLKFKTLSTPEDPIYGMTMSFSIGWLIPFIWGEGSRFLYENLDECNIEKSIVSKAIGSIFNTMFVEDSSPSLMKLISLQPYQYFLDGSLAMTVDGNWWMEGFRDSADFEWGVVPMPMNNNVCTGMYVDFWAVPAKSEHGEEAFEVLQFFLEEQQQKSGIMKGIPPLKTSASEIYRSRFPDLSDEEINVWFQGIEYGKVPAYFKGWSQFQTETTEILNKLGLGETALDDAVDQICNSYLSNNENLDDKSNL